jgi:serpin B
MIVFQRSMAGEDTPRHGVERGAAAAHPSVPAQPAGGRARQVGMRTKIVALLSLALVVSACAPAGSAGGDITLARADVPRASTAPEDAAAAGAAISAFGLDLYRALASGQTNVVLSPTSIALALAMARAGARGQTAAEMDAVMHALGADENAAWLNALDSALASRSGTFKDDSGQDLAVALRIANAPFAQQDMPLEKGYLEALASRFGAGLRLVDYVAATEDARKLINGWVDDQTEHRIPELLVPGVLTPDSRLTLVNAIYLKAPWQTAFAAEATKPGAFTRADGTTVEVGMMHVGEGLPYAAGTGWRAVEIPYVGGSLAMTVIVPDDLAAFEQALTADQLASITTGLAERPVSLTLPKFSIETKAQLADVLAALGMPTAFSDAADFSGITTAEQLAISEVIHQANIDVDEKGTEAAAATAVVMRATAMPVEPLTVRVDRPFLFALRDVPTGAVLFLGRVGDPSITR